MRAKDLMQSRVVTIREDASVGQLCDLLQAEHVNGLPVLNAEGEIVGIVSEEDILFGAMGAPEEGRSGIRGLVKDIMTSPAVCVAGETDVVELCRMMWGMRIHHIPVLEAGRLAGMVSSLDLVRAVAEGALRP